MNRYIVMLCAFVVAFALVTPNGAQAIPAFAKKYSLSCSSCHTAWPLLNAFGRRFKENGYRVNREQESSADDHVKTDAMALYKFTFLTARIKGYLLDHKKGKETKIRPFHEAEIMLAGNVFETVSAWIELKAEDEADWNVGAELGAVGFHPKPEFNIVAGYGPVFWTDPYDTLADGGRRMTRAHKVMGDIRYATGQSLRRGTPFITLYGRLGGKLFYEAGVSSGNSDPEGEDKKDFQARLAFDVTDHITFGGFLRAGKKVFDEVAETDVNFTWGGVDLQIQTSKFELLGAWLQAKEDIDDTGLDETNYVLYGQAMYFFRKDKRPLVVPIVRLENYTFNDGNTQFTDGVFNLTIYPWENINLSLELWTNLSTPRGVAKKNRVTILFNTVF